METKLRKQMAELREILNSIEKKKEQDIAIYGKPLKNKGMRDKADSKKRAIKLTKKSIKKIEEEEQKKLERKFKLSKRDAKVLDSIRNAGEAMTDENKLEAFVSEKIQTLGLADFAARTSQNEEILTNIQARIESGQATFGDFLDFIQEMVV